MTRYTMLERDDVHRWPFQRLNGLYCDLQLNNTPPLLSMARHDEAVKALLKATGLNPHLSVYGWPFCLDDLDGVDNMEGGAE